MRGKGQDTMKTLKEIGVVPNNKEPVIVDQWANNRLKDKSYVRGFNQAIELMSPKKVDVVINKDRLADLIRSAVRTDGWNADVLAYSIIQDKDTWCSIKAIE